MSSSPECPVQCPAQSRPARPTSCQTGRATAAGLEAILDQHLPVLDHGFLRVIDYMGDDAAIVEAARVSYGRGTRRLSQDAGLIRYLMRHRHTTPFEMCAIKLHVKLPIFVARQWIRHRMASINEYSARYSVLDREFYLPAPEHLAQQSATNRQGRAQRLGEAEAAFVLETLREDAERNYGHYVEMLNDPRETAIHDASRLGLARELARMNLTLNTYTQWYWKTDLHNLFHFLELRADRHAQYEIRAYAERILDVVAVWVPIAHQAFLDYQLHAVTFSRPMLAALRRMLAGENLTEQASGLSKREFTELMAVLEK